MAHSVHIQTATIHGYVVDTRTLLQEFAVDTD